MITTIELDDKKVLDEVIISPYTVEYKDHFKPHLCNKDQENVTALTFIDDMRKLCHYIIEDCSMERQRNELTSIDDTWYSDIKSKAFAVLNLLND